MNDKTNNPKEVKWNKEVQDKFKLAISKMPFFQRRIAEKMVTAKAEAVSKEEGLSEVSEKVLVLAFFSEVPAPFKGLMKNLLREAEIDYTKYVNEK